MPTNRPVSRALCTHILPRSLLGMPFKNAKESIASPPLSLLGPHGASSAPGSPLFRGIRHIRQRQRGQGAGEGFLSHASVLGKLYRGARATKYSFKLSGARTGATTGLAAS